MQQSTPKPRTKKKPAEQAAAPAVIAYKGFGPDWKCRDFQYKVGKSYEHKGRVEACERGFHASDNPLDVWNYYGPCEARFATVELSGEMSRHDDSKVSAAKITIKAELGLPQFIGDAVKFLMALCKDSSGEATQAASGHSSKLAASGDYSKLAASGHSSKLAASGDSSQLAASGKSSLAMAAAVNCTARAGELGCIVLTRWVDSEKRYRVCVGYVGEDGIEPNVAYRLNDKHELVKA
ncbi:MAG: hypothetical protein ABIR26_17545 [Ramlibacter sp.]